MRKTNSATPNELLTQMLIEGKDCGIAIFHLALPDGQEPVLVAAFRSPTGVDRLLTAIHFLCLYWIDVGLAEADDFADLLAKEIEGTDPHD